MDDEVIAIRDYINDGGTVLVTGQQALQGAWLQLLYNPLGSSRRTRGASPTRLAGQGNADDPVGQKTNCIIVSNDFIQYYLGAWISVIAATDDDVSTLPFKGVGGPFGTHAVHAQRRGLGRQPGQHAQTFVTTSSILPASEFPQFASDARDRLRPPAGL